MLFNNQSILSIQVEAYPAAYAEILGSSEYPDLLGNIYFYILNNGVYVAAEVNGLPMNQKNCGGGVFGFHIHEGGMCSGDSEDPFRDAGMHYNPDSCEHPYHAGDMPPLFSNNGYAFMSFFTERFKVKEIIGKTVIIHDRPDDFKTQPAGDSGNKIGCGEIKWYIVDKIE